MSWLNKLGRQARVFGNRVKVGERGRDSHLIGTRKGTVQYCTCLIEAYGAEALYSPCTKAISRLI